MGGLVGGASAAEMPMASGGTIAGGPVLTPPPPPVTAPQPSAPAPVQAPTMMASATPGTIVSEGGATKPTAGVDTAQLFDKKFAGSPLQGKWDLVKSSAEKHGVPPALAAAVMAQETGWGKKMAGENNPGGVKDFSKGGTQKSYDNIGKGIDDAVKVMAKNYNAAGGDLTKMRDSYAPLKDHPLNKHWLPNVSSFYKQFIPK